MHTYIHTVPYHAYYTMHIILNHHPDLSISFSLPSVSPLPSYHNTIIYHPDYTIHSHHHNHHHDLPYLLFSPPSLLFSEYHEEVISQGHDNNLGGLIQLPAGLANIPAGIVNNVSGGEGIREE